MNKTLVQYPCGHSMSWSSITMLCIAISANCNTRSGMRCPQIADFSLARVLHSAKKSRKLWLLSVTQSEWSDGNAPNWTATCKHLLDSCCRSLFLRSCCLHLLDVNRFGAYGDHYPGESTDHDVDITTATYICRVQARHRDYFEE